MAWADIWQLKQTEDAKCVALNKVSIFGIQKEIERINISDRMAVVATMMESIADTWIKGKEDKRYQAYDALVFYRFKKKIEAPTPAPVEKPLDIPMVEL